MIVHDCWTRVIHRNQSYVWSERQNPAYNFTQRFAIRPRKGKTRGLKRPGTESHHNCWRHYLNGAAQE